MPRPLVDKPVIIAHRGVPESHLEHTRPSYRAAIELGADYIEPDVVATADGHLVVRHESEIGRTTDIAARPEFADRRITKVIDGKKLTGWFTEDLTLEEVLTLRTCERIPKLRPQNRALAGREQILTLDDVLQIHADENARRDAGAPALGVYVETKHPSHFLSLGFDLNALLLTALERFDLNGEGAPVIIQSMETGNLRRFAGDTALPRVQLLQRTGGPADLVAAGDDRSYGDLAMPEGLDFIASYAHGVGPHKDHIFGRDSQGHWTGPTNLVADAHDRGLLVHPWTLRSENHFLPAHLRRGSRADRHGDAHAEHLAFFDAGVDGVFTDVTATAVAARAQWWDRQPAGG